MQKKKPSPYLKSSQLKWLKKYKRILKPLKEWPFAASMPGTTVYGRKRVGEAILKTYSGGT
jgi:hypothetical protein